MIKGLHLHLLGVFILVLLPVSVQSQTVAPSASPSPSPSPTQAEEIDPDDVIRVNTSLVSSPVLVIGRNGKFVPSLRQEDFEVYEDGVSQKVAYFAPVESPYTFLILIDCSRSILFSLEDIKSSATSFVDRMRPNDRAIVVTFSDEVAVISKSSNDRLELKRLIQAIQPGGASRVYDALTSTISNLLHDVTGRKALLLFTDGVDNASRESTSDAVLQVVQRTEVIIHPVQLGTYEAMSRRSLSKLQLEGSGFSQQDYLKADQFLHQLAELSNTGVYPVNEISDLDRVVAGIVDELHNEYSIGYYPQTKGQPGEIRKVEIKVKQPQLTARSRGGYVVDQSGLPVRSPVKSSTALDLSSSVNALPVPRAENKTKPSVGARWICKGPGVQTDLAVVKEATVSQCPKASDEQGNAWYVQSPRPKETVCKGFLIWNGNEIAAAPIPYGYVVTGETSAASCSKSQDTTSAANAWLVEIPSSGLTVCKSFPLPRGFVTAGERTIAACPATTRKLNAWIIKAK